MAARARVTVDQAGIDDLLSDPKVERFVTLGARELARTAKELAPDGGPHRGVRETYRSTPAEHEADRTVATAYTADMAGHLVEWGSVNNTAYAPLRRAAERLGLRTVLAWSGR